MKLCETINELNLELDKYRKNKQTIGFVPTMGALHDGHIEIIKKCNKENKCTVVSIFVNPTQFNNPTDLKNYPRILDKDIQKLQDTKTDIIFFPSDKEMYPTKDNRIFNLGKLTEVLEGKYRPGHFNGVAQIVSKLFDAVKPDNAYFGKKDFQQLAVINSLIANYGYKINIIGFKTIREDDGLAMSSRNLLLEQQYRTVAPVIYEFLKKSVNIAKTNTPAQTINFVIENINKTNLLKVEYFEIVNAYTFEKIYNWNDAKTIVGCIAVFAGKIRLIDNINYN